MKRNRPASEKRSAQKPWICKILEGKVCRKSSEVVKPLEKAVGNQPAKPLPSDERNNNTRVSRDGPTTHLLCKNSKSGPNETCPSRGVIHTQNFHGLSGKDKQLESLFNPLVDIMISKEIMTYCLQETWILGNEVIMVRGNMVFLHNRCEREEGTKGRNPGGVAIILVRSRSRLGRRLV